MPSFDIVSKLDHQTLDNVLNVARRELINRFDFRGSKTEIELQKKELIILVLTEDDMRMKSIIDVIRSRMAKQGLDPACLDLGKDIAASGNMVRKEIKIKEGIDPDTARKIIKDIKESKMKVQAQLMDDIVRVTGKKIDELQVIISLVSQKSYELPLQFVNMK
ncbi:MAG: YajQ family cyclic di-GMP-binding protein [Bacteroidia bacterium]